MGSGPAAGAEPGSRQGEWGAVRSWAHLGSRPHLLVQAVPVQRVRGPRENCRTEAGLSRAGRTPRPRGAQPQSPASPTAPHGPGFCSLTAAPRPPPHPEAAEGSRPVHGPAVSQQLREGTSSLSQPRGPPPGPASAAADLVCLLEPQRPARAGGLPIAHAPHALALWGLRARTPPPVSSVQTHPTFHPVGGSSTLLFLASHRGRGGGGGKDCPLRVPLLPALGAALGAGLGCQQRATVCGPCSCFTCPLPGPGHSGPAIATRAAP